MSADKSFAWLMGVALLGASLAVSAGSTDSVDTFENGLNPNHWTYGSFLEEIVPAGGNPGAWFHGPELGVFNPVVLAQAWRHPGELGPVWQGFWSPEHQVRRISFDAQTSSIRNEINFPYAETHRMTVMFIRKRGNSDPLDDDWVYFVGPEAPPAPREGWKHYTFDIPSKFSQSMPPGWQGGWAGDENNLRPGVTWQQVLTEVDEIRIHWFNPKYYYLIDDYWLGIDNIVFETEYLPPPQPCTP